MCVIDYWAYIPTNEFNVNNLVFSGLVTMHHLISNSFCANSHFIALVITYVRLCQEHTK